MLAHTRNQGAVKEAILALKESLSPACLVIKGPSGYGKHHFYSALNASDHWNDRHLLSYDFEDTWALPQLETIFQDVLEILGYPLEILEEAIQTRARLRGATASIGSNSPIIGSSIQGNIIEQTVYAAKDESNCGLEFTRKLTSGIKVHSSKRSTKQVLLIMINAAQEGKGGLDATLLGLLHKVVNDSDAAILQYLLFATSTWEPEELQRQKDCLKRAALTEFTMEEACAEAIEQFQAGLEEDMAELKRQIPGIAETAIAGMFTSTFGAPGPTILGINAAAAKFREFNRIVVPKENKGEQRWQTR